MPTDSSLTARLGRRLPDLVAAVATDAAAPAWGSVAEETVRVLVRCLQDDRPAVDEDLELLRTSAVRAAESGTSLSDLLAALYAGTRVVWDALTHDARHEGDDTLRRTGNQLLHVLEQLISTIAEAYFEEQHAIRAEQRDARRALASALISGEPVDWPEAHLGVRIAPAYLAVALQLEPKSPESGADDPGGAARQRLRRLNDRLDAFAGEPILGLLDAGGGTALVPIAADEAADALARLPKVIGQIGTDTNTDVVAGAAACVGVIAVARAARQARDVLRIARRLGRPPGVYVLDDVLLEYQLTRDSDARPLLTGLLDPLEANPDLVRTLECYFEHELDRRRSASALHVHPNTLDYRLRRIGQLTGLDPAKPSGQQLLAAALTARRLV